MELIEQLNKTFNYDPDTGILTRKKLEGKPRQRTAGRRVGNTLNAHGYRMVGLNSKLLYCHRVIMQMKLGRELKRGEIVDHINGDPSDNRLCNLRLTDQKGNTRASRKKSAGKSSKYKGVCFRKDRAHTEYPWVAAISSGAKQWSRRAKTELDAAYYYNCERLRRGWPIEGLNVLEREAV
jgi:hypothetical protein